MIAARITLLSCALCALTLVQAQYREKMDFQLKAYLQFPHEAGAQVDLFIHGDVGAVSSAVRGVNGSVKDHRPNLVSARVPVDRVMELAGSPAVHHFEFSLEQGHVLNDSMRVKSRVDLVHAGLPPLPQAYDGTGVVMGIIDSGLDWQHADFKNSDGTTRILKYWDQTLPQNSQTPQPYDYGQVWTKAQIDAGQMTSVDQPSYNGHGTTVAGTAAGNGLANGRHKGVAPGADIIIVSASFGGNFRAKVADAVQYIVDEAAALGKPVVMNASLGSYLGSHDGMDAAALLIDDILLEQGGRVLVCAVGNSNTVAPYHLRTEVDSDTSFTWFQYNPSSALGYGAVWFEVWADTADFNNVQYAIGADRTAPTFQFRGRTPFHNVQDNLGEVVVDQLISPSGNLLATVETYAVLRGGQYQLTVHLQQPDSNAYNFRFMTTGDGVFDIWSTAVFGTSNIVNVIPTVGQYPPIAAYVLPDNNKHMVDSWACSSNVLTVANYQNETNYIDYYGVPRSVPGTENDIALASSKGPTRDERQKPDLAATGDITFSAGPLNIIASFIAGLGDKLDPGGMHIRNGGSSMASPVVAGVAALYLQKCPTAPVSEVIAAINGTAFADGFTGAVPNNRWGHGKVDAHAALINSNVAPFDLELTGPPEFCEGQSILVYGPDGFAAYDWSNGATTPQVAYEEEGPLSLIATNSSGCIGYSDTLTFTILPTPPVPTITVEGDIILTSSAGDAYQWFLNNAAMDGETGQVHVAGTSGTYQVAVSNAEGCSSFSAPVDVIITGIGEHGAEGLAVWPSPARDAVQVRLPSNGTGLQDLYLLDARGRQLGTAQAAPGSVLTLELKGLAPGTYALQCGGGSERVTARFIKLP